MLRFTTWWAQPLSAHILGQPCALSTACAKLTFMIITESFVWINFPKTASTFVRECLRELYTVPWWNFAKQKRFKTRWIREINVPNIRSENPLRKGKPTPHGIVRQIPPEHKNLQIVSAVRMPLNWRLSLYRYADWKKKQALTMPIGRIIAKYPKFPDLTFDEFTSYLEFIQTERKIKIGDQEILLGIQSAAMLEFFSDYKKENYDELQFETQADLFALFEKIRFFDAETISVDLHSFLFEIGFCKTDISFILRKKRVNSSKQTPKPASTTTFEKIKNDEWIVYQIIKTRKHK